MTVLEKARTGAGAVWAKEQEQRSQGRPTLGSPQPRTRRGKHLSNQAGQPEERAGQGPGPREWPVRAARAGDPTLHIYRELPKAQQRRGLPVRALSPPAAGDLTFQPQVQRPRELAAVALARLHNPGLIPLLSQLDMQITTAGKRLAQKRPALREKRPR